MTGNAFTFFLRTAELLQKFACFWWRRSGCDPDFFRSEPRIAAVFVRENVGVVQNTLAVAHSELRTFAGVDGEMIKFSCLASDFSVYHFHLWLKAYTHLWNNSKWSSFGMQSIAQSMAPRFHASWCWFGVWCFGAPDRMLAGPTSPKTPPFYSCDRFQIKLKISNARELLEV